MSTAFNVNALVMDAQTIKLDEKGRISNGEGCDLLVCEDERYFVTFNWWVAVGYRTYLKDGR